MSSQFKKENNDLLLAFLTLLGIICLVAIVGFFMLQKEPDIVQGEVDVDEFRVSSKVPARVLRLCVDEGDTVHVGDTLAVMEAPDVQAKLEQAKAAENAAQAQNQKAIKGTRYEQIQGAYDLWQKSKAGVEIAQKTYARVKNLNAEGVIPAQKLDEATAQRDAAIATERAAHSQYTMAVNGAQREDKEAAAALVQRAKGAVSEVNSYIKETYLTATCDGEVSEKYPQVGELVGAGAPIMSISIMSSKWVTFNVREDLLKDIKMGSIFTAFVPALNNQSIKLKVFYMKDLGTYAAWKATKSTGQYDLKTFEVKARPLQYIEGLRPGMSVILKKK
jgi:HlyD family secretion protein